MTETLQEFFDSRGVRMGVDRQAGVIRGVKILGLESRNGRTLSARGAGPGGPALRRRQGEREPSQEQPRRPARLPGPHRRDPRRDGPAAKGCSPTSISIPSTRWPSSFCGTPSTPRRTWAFRTTSRPAPPAAASAWWSRPSPACRAWTWWPIRRRRAGCSSRRPRTPAPPAGDGPAPLTVEDLKREYPAVGRGALRSSRPPRCGGWRRKWPG